MRLGTGVSILVRRHKFPLVGRAEQRGIDFFRATLTRARLPGNQKSASQSEPTHPTVRRRLLGAPNRIIR